MINNNGSLSQSSPDALTQALVAAYRQLDQYEAQYGATPYIDITEGIGAQQYGTHPYSTDVQTSCSQQPGYSNLSQAYDALQADQPDQYAQTGNNNAMQEYYERQARFDQMRRNLQMQDMQFRANRSASLMQSQLTNPFTSNNYNSNGYNSSGYNSGAYNTGGYNTGNSNSNNFLEQFQQRQQHQQLLALLQHIADLETQWNADATHQPLHTGFPVLGSSSALGNNACSGSGSILGSGNAAEPAQFAQNFAQKSWGDPHIDTTIDGTTTNKDEMHDILNLLDAGRSIDGGYRVSTKVTDTDANGKTFNKQADIVLDNGVRVTETFDGKGKQSVNIHTNKLDFQLAVGQTINIGDDETATLGDDGKLVINAHGRSGASLKTEITNNGSGLDINTQGTNAYISGYGIGANTTNATKEA